MVLEESEVVSLAVMCFPFSKQVAAELQVELLYENPSWIVNNYMRVIAARAQSM